MCVTFLKQEIKFIVKVRPRKPNCLVAGALIVRAFATESRVLLLSTLSAKRLSQHKWSIRLSCIIEWLCQSNVKNPFTRSFRAMIWSFLKILRRAHWPNLFFQAGNKNHFRELWVFLPTLALKMKGRRAFGAEATKRRVAGNVGKNIFPLPLPHSFTFCTRGAWVP